MKRISEVASALLQMDHISGFMEKILFQCKSNLVIEKKYE